MSVVAVAVLVLLIVALLAGVVLLVAMVVKDKPFYGAMSVCLLSGPGGVLTFTYVALAGL